MMTGTMLSLDVASIQEQNVLDLRTILANKNSGDFCRDFLFLPFIDSLAVATTPYSEYTTHHACVADNHKTGSGKQYPLFSGSHVVHM